MGDGTLISLAGRKRTARDTNGAFRDADEHAKGADVWRKLLYCHPHQNWFTVNCCQPLVEVISQPKATWSKTLFLSLPFQ